MVLTAVLALKKKKRWLGRILSKREPPVVRITLARPPDVVPQLNVMYRAALDECKRREVRFGIDERRTRERYEDVRAYLVQLMDSAE